MIGLPKITRTILLGIGCLLTLSTLAPAVDWPQYRGPNFDGSTPEKISSDWKANPPKVLWKISAGAAFGSFAAVGGRVYFEQERKGKEVCTALNVADGKEAWSAEIDETIFEKQGGNGPRTTPAVVDGKVYVMGTRLKLFCFNAADGKKIWMHDLVGEFSGQKSTSGISNWGNAASPVVDRDLVIVAGGGSLQTYLAFNKEDGKLVWKRGDDKITHATPTPTPATIHGVRQIIFFMQAGLVSIKPDTGAELWRYPFKFSVSTASSPIVGGDIVYCSAGYGVGAGACKITKEGDGFKATELWRVPGERMNHWTTPVFHDGYIYGIYGFKQFGTAPVECLDIATGKTKWSKEGFGSGGGTILAGGTLVVQHDTGAITLIDPKPDAVHELGRIQPIAGKCWTMPVVANGKLFARSDKEVVCLEVK